MGLLKNLFKKISNSKNTKHDTPDKFEEQNTTNFNSVLESAKRLGLDESDEIYKDILEMEEKSKKADEFNRMIELIQTQLNTENEYIALNTLESMLDDNVDNRWVYRTLSGLYESENKFSQAIEVWEKGIWVYKEVALRSGGYQNKKGILVKTKIFKLEIEKTKKRWVKFEENRAKREIARVVENETEEERIKRLTLLMKEDFHYKTTFIYANEFLKLKKYNLATEGFQLAQLKCKDLGFLSKIEFSKAKMFRQEKRFKDSIFHLLTSCQILQKIDKPPTKEFFTIIAKNLKDLNSKIEVDEFLEIVQNSKSTKDIRDYLKELPVKIK